MKIAIPVHNDRLNPHFGRTEAFEVFEVDDQSKSISARRTIPLGTSGGCGALPGLLKKENVDTVLCGGLGHGAKANLERAGLKVVAGAPAGDAGALVEAYLGGTLKTGSGVCNHGEGHTHHHRHRRGPCHCGGHGQGDGQRNRQEA
jgi:predicted Fe-Mo cluster-binding NifX family protein